MPRHCQQESDEVQPDVTDSDIAFRAEVRAFIAEKYDADLRAMNARQAGLFAEHELATRWHRILYEKGWITPWWPVEHGGTGWTPSQHRIFLEECANAAVPIISQSGLKLLGPAIMRYGTEEQKAYFLPAVRSGEHVWCQGYSEPGAGSDLASLQTRAVREGCNYVVNGSKIWTTHAHHANWIFMLVRTATEGKPQAGISFLVVPMDTPGITVQPILSMSGEHEVNQVFFDNVIVPAAYRIGDENDGWSVAKAVLSDERGTVSQSQRLGQAIRQVETAAIAQQADDGGRLCDDIAFRLKFARLKIACLAVEWTDRRSAQGADMAPEIAAAIPNIQKIQASVARQELNELRVEALAGYGWVDQRAGLGIAASEVVVGPDYALTAMTEFLDSRARSIYAGSSEVQRNIIARTAFGLK
jgi:alkylation response protein AidB-like acyl-CoA dehydrogenase